MPAKTPATQIELARKLGLSRSTVAAALNPNSPVRLREATIRLVREEAERQNYRPNQYAQVMRRGRSGVIGIFHFGGLSQVAAERTWHASKAILAAGFKVLSTDISWSPDGIRAGCEAMLDAKVEGVVVAGLNNPYSAQDFSHLLKSGLPLVTLSGNELPGVPHIRGDADKAMYDMARHLISLGRRRLLLMAGFAGTYTWAGAERLKGFERAIGAPLVEKFSPSGRKVAGWVIKGRYSDDVFDLYEPARDTMRRVLAESVLPDAVLCGNDDWAIGALSALREAGVKVPGDIAVTGYDDTSVAPYLEVPLTTVAQPSEEMARRAVEILIKLINGEKLGRAERLIKLPCKLVVRNSCGGKGSKSDG